MAQEEDFQVPAFQSLKEAAREWEKKHMAPAQRRKAWERHQVGGGRASGLCVVLGSIGTEVCHQQG